VRKREKINRMGRERTNIVERWSETESEGERAIEGRTLRVEEGDNNDGRQSERARLSGGGWYMRDKEEYGTAISPLEHSTLEEEYERVRSDNRTNRKE